MCCQENSSQEGWVTMIHVFPVNVTPDYFNKRLWLLLFFSFLFFSFKTTVVKCKVFPFIGFSCLQCPAASARRGLFTQTGLPVTSVGRGATRSTGSPYLQQEPRSGQRQLIWTVLQVFGSRYFLLFSQSFLNRFTQEKREICMKNRKQFLEADNCNTALEGRLKINAVV